MKTKDRILKTALELFVEQGIDKTTTRQITDQLGLAEGTLFVHYKTKQELINQLFLSIKQQEAETLMNAIDLSGNPEQDCKMITRVVVDYFIEHYDEYQFIELVNFGHHIEKNIRNKANVHFAKFSELFDQWIAQQAIKPVEPALLEIIVWNIIRANIVFAQEQALRQVTEEMVDTVWDAIKK